MAFAISKYLFIFMYTFLHNLPQEIFHYSTQFPLPGGYLPTTLNA